MHGSSASNIYDSWRSQRQHPADYYYDSHNQFNKKMGPYPPEVEFIDHQQQHNEMPMYTYNPKRYHNRQDYDRDF